MPPASTFHAEFSGPPRLTVEEATADWNAIYEAVRALRPDLLVHLTHVKPTKVACRGVGYKEKS